MAGFTVLTTAVIAEPSTFVKKFGWEMLIVPSSRGSGQKFAKRLYGSIVEIDAMQSSFSELEYAVDKSLTYRDRFLVKIEVVTLAELAAYSWHFFLADCVAFMCHRSSLAV
jgi:hypothetical protein